MRASSGLLGRDLIARALIILVMVVALLFVLFPVYWMVITSLKLPREIFRVPSLWPQVFTAANYRILIEDKEFLVAIRNSFIVASSVTLISLVVASLAAYSMVRFRYRFKGLIGRLILFAYLTPTSLLFIPLSILIARLQLGNTLHGLIFVYLTFSLPVSTWMLQAYFAAVPRELEEQGMIDGLSRLGALFRIVLPLSAPGLAAVAIFTFTGAWNELLLALVLIHLRVAPHGAACPQLPHHERCLAVGPAHGRRSPILCPADDPLLRGAALYRAGHHAGSVKG
jgi:multiple sugar transport system permease protein